MTVRVMRDATVVNASVMVLNAAATVTVMMQTIVAWIIPVYVQRVTLCALPMRNVGPAVKGKAATPTDAVFVNRSAAMMRIVQTATVALCQMANPCSTIVSVAAIAAKTVTVQVTKSVRTTFVCFVNAGVTMSVQMGIHAVVVTATVHRNAAVTLSVQMTMSAGMEAASANMSVARTVIVMMMRSAMTMIVNVNMSAARTVIVMMMRSARTMHDSLLLQSPSLQHSEAHVHCPFWHEYPL